VVTCGLGDARRVRGLGADRTWAHTTKAPREGTAEPGRRGLTAESAENCLLDYRYFFGPGYRVYFGQDGDTLVILLGGGTKKGQGKDIKQAQRRWADP